MIPDRDANVVTVDAQPALTSSNDAANGSVTHNTNGTFTQSSDAESVIVQDLTDGSVAPSVESDANSSPTTTFDPAPPGLAGFAFVIEGVAQHPMSCPSDNWEFSAATANPQCGYPPPCPSLDSVYLINTGHFPVAYIASGLWMSQAYVPGVATGDPYQLVGVLDPGGKVDITSVYDGGYTDQGVVALLGSSAPFSSPDAGKYLSDEGSIPWPAGVAGSEGSSTMWLAEIEVKASCGIASKEW
jgi:hypothetical protein